MPSLKHRILLAALVVMLLGLLAPGVAHAQSPGTLRLTASAGYEGYCRQNAWVPVRVELENSGADIEGQVEVVFNQWSNRKTYAQAISLPNQSRKTVTLYAYMEGYSDVLNIRLISSAGEELAATTARINVLNDRDYLSGALSENRSPFTALGAMQVAGASRIATLAPADIPEQTLALESLDTLIVSAVDSGQLSSAQRQALAGWLANGGQLLVTGGADWQRTAAGLGDLLPLEPQGTRTLASLEPLVPAGGDEQPVVVVQGALRPDARSIYTQDNTPLVIERSVGLGRVIYLAFDPAQAPFAAWNGQVDFYQRLLTTTAPAPLWNHGFRDWDSARQAVTARSSLGMPSAILIGLFLFAYIIAIGPLNYLLLSKLKRRELAWLTVPALVILFSLISFAAGSFSRGYRPWLSHLALVQVYPGQSQARVDGLVAVFSPRRTDYELQTGPAYLAHALPENKNVWSFVQQPSGETRVSGLHTDIGGSETLAVQGSTPAPQIGGEVTLDLTGTGDGFVELKGEIFNDSDLTLQNVVLFTQNSSLKLDTLAPGQRRPVEMSAWMGSEATRKDPGKSDPYAHQNAPANNWVDVLIGANAYYDDPVTFQRRNILNAFDLTSEFVPPQNKVFLVGWSDTSPLEARLSSYYADDARSSLYMVLLNTQLQFPDKPQKLGPGFFIWSVLEETASDPTSAYGSFLRKGYFSLAYTPRYPLPFKSVKALTLHLGRSDDLDPVRFKTSLWDFTTGQWVQQDINAWGHHEISSPERYVSPDGEIRARIQNDLDESVTIRRIDFTLEVQP